MRRVPKRYDRAYFDKWYRGAQRVNSAAEVRRKVSLAVAVTEYFIQEPLKSVLDIGCGEGAWLGHLQALRPNVEYMGLDPSEYVVRRFGQKRNIRQASFGELPSLRIAKKFDLVICSDVLHYVAEDEIRAGIAEIARVANGLAFIEVLTKEDDIVGDLRDLTRRPVAWYIKTFADAGLISVAPYCFLAPARAAFATELEFPHPPLI
jgi:SAM-dependent methyltransferase